MVISNYDKEANSVYILFDNSSDYVGTLQATGNIRFRKPYKIINLTSPILIDFTEKGTVVGIEICGSSIPGTLTQESCLHSAKIQLTPKSGTGILDISKEANSIYNSFKSSTKEPDITFIFNEKLYKSNGFDCFVVESKEAERV